MTLTPAPAGPGHPRRLRFGVAWGVFLLLTAAFLAYGPALGGAFVWDDEDMVVNNPLIRSSLFAGEIFGHYLDPYGGSAHYRPLQVLTYLGDYWCWGLNPFGYHLTNTLLHGAAGALLFLLLRRIVSLLWPAGASQPGVNGMAFAAALLWVVHPAHNAAVAYVSGRADPLAFGLATAAWLLLLSAVTHEGRGSSWWRLAGGGLCAFGALATRESAVLSLVLFAAFLGCFGTRLGGWRKMLPALAVCVLALVAYGALRLGLPPREPDRSLPFFDAPGRALLFLRALGAYGQLVLWPARLAVDRQLGVEADILAHGVGQAHLWLAWDTFSGIAALALLLFGCGWRGEGRSLRRFGALWFFGTLLPVSNLLRLNATFAEHWLYLPSVGLLFWGVGWAVEVSPLVRRRLAPALVLLAVLALGARTFVRSEQWTDARAFYASNIAAGGDSPRMRFNLALACRRAGETATAERLLAEVAARWPNYAPARRVLEGTALEALTPEAREERLRARLGWNGNLPTGSPAPERVERFQLLVRLAEVQAKLGRTDDAQATLSEALGTLPDNPARWAAVPFQTALLQRAGRGREALALVESFTQTYWWHRGARILLGDLRGQFRDFEGALDAFRWADRMDVHHAEALCHVAALELGRGQLGSAIAAQEAAVRKAPAQAKPHHLLGMLYAQVPDPVRSREQFTLAQRLDAETVSGFSRPALRENMIQ